MLLTVAAVVNHQYAIKVVFAAAAKVGGMFFHDTQGNKINRHYDTDTKYRFAQNDK